MNDYKIKVNNEAESREAQELFFELGFTNGQFGYNVFPQFIANFNTDECGSFTTKTTNGLDYHKEITLQQLRDLALEKQVASHNIEQQALKANPKLFLDPTQNYAEIEWDGSFLKQDHWVEVPNSCYNFAFKKTNGDVRFSESCFNPYFGEVLLWQRTQDEPFLTPESVVEPQGIDATLAERQSTYGDFVYVANTTGKLFAEIKNGKNAHMLPYAHEEALHMICSKIARIVNGDCNHKDSWHDIAGYAKLIENLIKE